jgi:hypothetical protein
VAVNQSLFLVRDNAIFLVDVSTPSKNKVVGVYFGAGGYLGSNIVSLHKLRLQEEDKEGFKVTTIKVIAIHRNGTAQVFAPEALALMANWSHKEITQTPMSTNREQVINTFQNQNASNYIYITTFNSASNS